MSDAARKLAARISTSPAARFFPILEWGGRYDRTSATNDLVAAVIVTIMLIPQSLAYALLAGLPPQVGLYASILPLVAYGIFGSSRTLAVGPVAVISLMTAAAAGEAARKGIADAYTAAVLLAFLSGGMLLILGFLRLGFMASFLSHPVISGFITASGIIIAVSQVKGILGIKGEGETLPKLLATMWADIGSVNWLTAAIGVSVALFLFWSRKRLKPLLAARGVKPRLADIAAKAAPVVSVLATIAFVWGFGLDKAGVAIVGAVPAGLPPLTLPAFDARLAGELLVPALLMSIVGFVESVSVAQTLAAKRRQRIDPDQELVGLGASNIAAGLSGGYPVTGGFARSVVNFDAGAETPAAGMFTAVGIAMATLLLTPVLYYLPKATLAATIIVAVLSLVDLGAVRRTWSYSRPDGLAMVATIAATLIFGVETGITAGVLFSVAAHLYSSSRPHYAVVGQVPGTEHFRNVKRHKVVTAPDILSLRVDESLYFANARYLEDIVLEKVAAGPAIRHVVLMCPSVSSIDVSALEALEALNLRLSDAGVTLHLSEVKGPVMDRLQKSHFLQDLTGRVFLTQYDALATLAPELTAATLGTRRRITGSVTGGK